MNAVEPNHMNLRSVPAAIEGKWLKQQQQSGKKTPCSFLHASKHAIIERKLQTRIETQEPNVHISNKGLNE